MAIAVGETVIPLHPPLHVVGVPKVMERERQQNDRLVNGCPKVARSAPALWPQFSGPALPTRLSSRWCAAFQRGPVVAALPFVIFHSLSPRYGQDGIPNLINHNTHCQDAVLEKLARLEQPLLHFAECPMTGKPFSAETRADQYDMICTLLQVWSSYQRDDAALSSLPACQLFSSGWLRRSPLSAHLS